MSKPLSLYGEYLLNEYYEVSDDEWTIWNDIFPILESIRFKSIIPEDETIRSRALFRKQQCPSCFLDAPDITGITLLDVLTEIADRLAFLGSDYGNRPIDYLGELLINLTTDRENDSIILNNFDIITKNYEPSIDVSLIKDCAREWMFRENETSSPFYFSDDYLRRHPNIDLLKSPIWYLTDFYSQFIENS